MAVLYSRLSGYVSACLRALVGQHGVSLLVACTPPASNAPFDAEQFAWIDHLLDRSTLSQEQLDERIAAFDPDLILMSGWFDRAYLAVARRRRAAGTVVVAGCDAQWNGTFRQYVGRAIAPWYLHPSIDVLWVAGERQRQFAARLGFRDDRCMSGYYACDFERFAAVHHRRRADDAPTPRSFLFVGRYEPVKGIDVLLEAYARYRTQARQPWSLHCVGAGGLAHRLQNLPGVTDRGFVQPDRLPGLLQHAGAFILPSRREPWGVALHEAAAAGLPLVSSTACGAAVHLLQDGYNGFLFETASAAGLAQAMGRIAALPEDRYAHMGAGSHALARQFTPTLWAEKLMRPLRTANPYLK